MARTRGSRIEPVRAEARDVAAAGVVLGAVCRAGVCTGAGAGTGAGARGFCSAAHLLWQLPQLVAPPESAEHWSHAWRSSMPLRAICSAILRFSLVSRGITTCDTARRSGS